MFSNITNVNIVTSLLVAHHVMHVVVCPGSRNAPLVHNFNEHPDIKCFPITDERSAGFYALGMARALHQPVAVCVTSGSALLNLAPAVAEAAYQHVRMVVISADRPERWIGQLDGQTLPQPSAFGGLVNRSVSLPSAMENDEQRWHCNRLVNEALLATTFPQYGPVHVNVPVEQPLFSFSLEQLPTERVVNRIVDKGCYSQWLLARWLLEASCPMVVVGQIGGDSFDGEEPNCRKGLDLMASTGVLLAERLCHLPVPLVMVEEALSLVEGDDGYIPDLIVYFGDSLVSKKLKAFMRKNVKARVVMVCRDGELHDVTMHASEVVVCRDVGGVFAALAEMHETRWDPTSREHIHVPEEKQQAFHDKWQHVLDFVAQFAEAYSPEYSQMAAVKYFEQQLEDMDYDIHVHYANSMPIRLANIYAGHPVYCNRGVNGIDGALSTAAGCSMVTCGLTFCVIGDLSFFYDQNALWNVGLDGRLRIILLNNGGGGIFKLLPGLERSGARDAMVAGMHRLEAKGICEQYDIGYLRASSMEEMEYGMVALVTKQTKRPMLLEIMTNMDMDAASFKDFNNKLKEIWQRENGKR